MPRTLTRVLGIVGVISALQIGFPTRVAAQQSTPTTVGPRPGSPASVNRRPASVSPAPGPPAPQDASTVSGGQLVGNLPRNVPGRLPMPVTGQQSQEDILLRVVLAVGFGFMALGLAIKRGDMPTLVVPWRRRANWGRKPSIAKEIR
jgi:hypothetical protein